MSRGRVRAIAALVALIVLAWGVWWLRRGSNGLDVRGVVLITLDTVRADKLGCYGNDGALTPTLDQLAAEGVRFERTLTTAPITLPAHASILSGTDPIAHGVRVNGAFAMDASNPTLATVMRKSGFKTGAFVSAFVLDRRFGLDTGFDRYDDNVDRATQERLGEETVDASLRFVEACGMAPFFVWVHLFDAHAPYAPPAEEAAKHELPYDGEIAYVDRCVRRLLDGLEQKNRGDDLLVAVVADHGEGLGEHGESTHTVFVYDSTMHVPMILWSPGNLPAERVIPGTTSVVSLAPTLLDLLELERPPAMYGASYAGAITSEGALPSDRPVYFESMAGEYYYGFAPLSGVDVAGDKLIVAPSAELYRVPDDPQELTNRFATEPSTARRLKQSLDQYVQEWQTDRASPRVVSKEDDERLSQLGYAAVPMGGIRDPKQGIVIIERLVTARASAAEDLPAAIDQLRSLSQEFPGIAEIHEQLADVLRQSGQPDAAVDEYRLAVSLRPNDPEILTSLAETWFQLGHLDKAEPLLDRALKLEPTHVRARVARGMIQLREGEFEGARRWFDEVLEGDIARGIAANPEVPSALFSRAICLKHGNNHRAALEDLVKVVSLVPDRLEFWMELAKAHETLAQFDEAIVAYSRGAELASSELRPQIEAYIEHLRK